MSQPHFRSGRLTSRTLKVVNLSNGVVVHSYTRQGQVGVPDMELSWTGGVAWIFHERTGFSVHKMAPRHEVVYRGPLSQGSLALSGPTLFWLTPAGPMSARLD